MVLALRIPWAVEAALVAVALLAGFVDAIAGGGGLLTLPALLLTGMSPQLALATNKGQSVFGSGVALARFYHSPLLNRKRIPPAFLAGFAGALLGVRTLKLIPNVYLAPVVMVLLVTVAIFMIFYRPPAVHVRRSVPRHPLIGALCIALLIGWYDGFFGPGTGTFLILAFMLHFHDEMHHASANAKVVNFASNLGSLCFFLWLGWIQWPIAIPMACGQALGGFLGAYVTIRHGQKLVRFAIILVSLALVGRLSWQLLVPSSATPPATTPAARAPASSAFAPGAR